MTLHAIVRHAIFVFAVTHCLFAQAGDVGRSRYTLHCAGCHQLDGGGATEIGVPRMKGVIGNFLRTPEGRDFLVQVPGSSQSSLNDAQLSDELNWIIRTMAEQSMPADFVPYSEGEVHVLRTHRPENIIALRKSITDNLAVLGFPVTP
jgi:cytochrome c2